MLGGGFMKARTFIKNVELMVDPIDVGTVHFMQTYTKGIPKDFQYKVISKSAKDNPYMGFVVEPYSLFLCHEIIDVEWAKKLIPDGFELVKTKVFDYEEPKYYSIIGCFNVHASAFWGTRIEFYIIAKNKETGLTSWLIIDYDTNTVSYDRQNGLIAGNAPRCIVTTNYDGEVIVDTLNSENGRRLVVTTDIKNGCNKPLAKELWIDGNLSIGYGREKSMNSNEVFSTIFNPKEVSKALEVPPEDVVIEHNDWYKSMISSCPTKVVCFPFAQHYISDSPGHYSKVSNETELVERMNNMRFEDMSKYSSEALKKMFKFGQVISLVTIITLVVLYLIK